MTRSIWGVWALTGAVYLTMILWSLPHLTQLAGGLAMFDMRPGGYTLAEAQAILTGLGDEGRAFYHDVQHRLDTVFPVLEAAALSLAFVRLYPRAVALPLIAVAVAGALFDWLENAAVAAFLRVDPAQITADQVAAASRWSVLKSGAVTVALTALLIGLVLAGYRRYRGRAA